MIKAIIFDFGGIFSVNYRLGAFCEKYADKFKVDVEEFKKLTLSLWLKARVAEIDSELFWIELGKFTKTDPVEYKKMIDDFSGYREEILEYIIKNLIGKYKLGLLSNQIESWLEPILEEKGFKNVFDVITTSYGSKLAKPDIRIYKEVVKKLKVKPEECVFIDDMAGNLLPAEKLGMKTILFKDANQLFSDLDSMLEG